MNKLSPLTIILLGVSIAFVALSWGFFMEYQPNSTEAQYYTEYAAQLKTEADKLERAQRRREQAIEMVQTKAREWSAVAATRTPPDSLATGGINLAVNSWQLTVDARKFRNSVQRAVNAQIRKGGVTVINGPNVPFPPESAGTVLADYFNYPAFPFPIVFFDFGTVTVRGTYAQIMANVRSWANMPNYLAVTDGLQIQGTSPVLTGTYSLSVVGFIRGREIFPAVPEGAAPSGPGGGPGGASGGPRPGGAPGGPGGGRAGGGGPLGVVD